MVAVLTHSHIDPSEWIELGPLAVKTPFKYIAARVVARVRGSRANGYCNMEGSRIEFMCAGHFRAICNKPQT